jgi:ABC-type nitrate/sulfonate/bicarbonate transport system permease component
MSSVVAVLGRPWRRGARPLPVAWEAVAATVVFLVAWQIASHFMSPILLPSPLKVARAVGTILGSPQMVDAAVTSYVRVLQALLGGFVVGCVVAALMVAHARVAAFISTYLTFIQGIPSLCWVVMAVLWFRDVEVRIFFILVMVTLPGFALQMYDGYRSIPQDLKEMLSSLRPNPWHRFRYLIAPALVAPVLTIWKISLGIGIRVVLVAELVGGLRGIGFQLQVAEALINMAMVLAWTAMLVAFVLVSEKLLSILEGYALRWRPDEHAQRSESLSVGETVGVRA